MPPTRYPARDGAKRHRRQLQDAMEAVRMGSRPDTDALSKPAGLDRSILVGLPLRQAGLMEGDSPLTVRKVVRNRLLRHRPIRLPREDGGGGEQAGRGSGLETARHSRRLRSARPRRPPRARTRDRSTAPTPRVFTTKTAKLLALGARRSSTHRLDGLRRDRPGGPSCEWSGPSTRTRRRTRESRAPSEPAPPSGDETQADTAGVRGIVDSSSQKGSVSTKAGQLQPGGALDTFPPRFVVLRARQHRPVDEGSTWMSGSARCDDCVSLSPKRRVKQSDYDARSLVTARWGWTRKDGPRCRDLAPAFHESSSTWVQPERDDTVVPFRRPRRERLHDGVAHGSFG